MDVSETGTHRVIGRQVTPGLSPDMAVAMFELKTTGGEPPVFVAQAEREQGQPGRHADPGGAGQRNLNARSHSSAMGARPARS